MSAFSFTNSMLTKSGGHVTSPSTMPEDILPFSERVVASNTNKATRARSKKATSKAVEVTGSPYKEQLSNAVQVKSLREELKVIKRELKVGKKGKTPAC